MVRAADSVQGPCQGRAGQ